MIHPSFFIDAVFDMMASPTKIIRPPIKSATMVCWAESGKAGIRANWLRPMKRATAPEIKLKRDRLGFCDSFGWGGKLDVIAPRVHWLGSDTEQLEKELQDSGKDNDHKIDAGAYHGRKCLRRHRRPFLFFQLKRQN